MSALKLGLFCHRWVWLRHLCFVSLGQMSYTERTNRRREQPENVLHGQCGQAAILMMGLLAAVLVGAFVLGAVARGVGVRGTHQRAADLAALAGASRMRANYERLFEPAFIGNVPNPRHLSKPAYLALGLAAAMADAVANGAVATVVSFPDVLSFAPVRIRVTVHDRVKVNAGGKRRSLSDVARAEAELGPPSLLNFGSGGGYSGPLAYRQGKPMRPDVAIAFDRMQQAAQADGLGLIVVSGFRNDAEQAALWARHPDPKWVAPPGQSLHRLGTELDLGPGPAYGWLAANAARFGFVKRYAWEAWHFGYSRNAGSTSVGFGSQGGDGKTAIPSFVPPQFAAAISAAAQRWNVGAALLSAQLYAESNFNPSAVSPAGAKGIAQFMASTAGRYGLSDPFNAADAINAQAHLMHDLMRQFGSVPLALAAYNAGAGAVAGCGCIPSLPETRGYVSKVLGLLGGAGDSSGLAAAFTVRLVR